jgi:hypothetical protein
MGNMGALMMRGAWIHGKADFRAEGGAGEVVAMLLFGETDQDFVFGIQAIQ